MKTARKKATNAPVQRPGDEWMSIPRAATALGISYGGVVAKALRGEIESQHVGGRTFVSRASVERLLNQRQDPAA